MKIEIAPRQHSCRPLTVTSLTAAAPALIQWRFISFYSTFIPLPLNRLAQILHKCKCRVSVELHRIDVATAYAQLVRECGSVQVDVRPSPNHHTRERCPVGVWARMKQTAQQCLQPQPTPMLDITVQADALPLLKHSNVRQDSMHELLASAAEAVGVDVRQLEIAFESWGAFASGYYYATVDKFIERRQWCRLGMVVLSDEPVLGEGMVADMLGDHLLELQHAVQKVRLGHFDLLELEENSGYWHDSGGTRMRVTPNGKLSKKWKNTIRQHHAAVNEVKRQPRRCRQRSRPVVKSAGWLFGWLASHRQRTVTEENEEEEPLLQQQGEENDGDPGSTKGCTVFPLHIPAFAAMVIF